jgi:hypothetical protein
MQDGRTPLFYVALHRSLDLERDMFPRRSMEARAAAIVDVLVNNGADVDHRDNVGCVTKAKVKWTAWTTGICTRTLVYDMIEVNAFSLPKPQRADLNIKMSMHQVHRTASRQVTM